LLVGAKNADERNAVEFITRKYLTLDYNQRSYKDAELAVALRRYAEYVKEQRKNGARSHKGGHPSLSNIAEADVAQATPECESESAAPPQGIQAYKTRS
jgi:hypothetical protein